MRAYAGDVCQADFDVERPEMRAVVDGDLVVPVVAVGVARPPSDEAGRLDVPHGLAASVAAAAREQDLLSSRIRSSDAVVISPLLYFSSTCSNSSQRVSTTERSSPRGHDSIKVHHLLI
jgi:hypothetical protein